MEVYHQWLGLNGLKHTCVSPGDNNDLSGQIRDVLYFELAFRGKNLAENGSKITHGQLFLKRCIRNFLKGSFYLCISIPETRQSALIRNFDAADHGEREL
jgi:hypothetical protein